MGAVLRFILILVIAWYIYRVLDRVIGPVLFGKRDKKKTQPGNKGKEFRKSTTQGDVTITDYTKTSKNVKPREDDFVDFEEVE